MFSNNCLSEYKKFTDQSLSATIPLLYDLNLFLSSGKNDEFMKDYITNKKKTKTRSWNRWITKSLIFNDFVKEFKLGERATSIKKTKEVLNIQVRKANIYMRVSKFTTNDEFSKSHPTKKTQRTLWNNEYFSLFIDFHHLNC